MRVRLKRQSDTRRRATPTRRAHAAPVDVRAPQAPQAETAEPSQPQPVATGPEQRWRAEGGPADTASYRCGCGYVFEAPVSTSVSCPHCGAGQAW